MGSDRAHMPPGDDEEMRGNRLDCEKGAAEAEGIEPSKPSEQQP